VNVAGAIVAAAGLAPLLLGLDLRLRRVGLVVFVIGVGLMCSSLLATPIHHLRTTLTGHPAIGLGGAVVGIAGLVIAAAIIYRWPWLYLLAVVATAPARVPFHVGKTDANLLVPLYVVIAAGAAATAYELLREREPARGTGWIGMALVAFVGWSAISMAWSVDSHHGAIEMLFFYLPFGLMVARLAQLRIDPSALRAALTVQAVLAVVFATVALGQELTHHIFWNPGIEVENTYKSFFRVNSLFWDASIYARFMAVTLVLLAGVAIHRRASPWLLALMTYLFLGMYVSYSQSGYLALAVGTLALGASLWPRRVTIGIVATAGAAGLVALLIALSGSSANKVTSDRLHLWRLAKRVISDHPLTGAGLGGFSKAALAGSKHPWRVASAASHTTPLTVIAELGPVGIVLYVAMIAAVVVAAVGSGPYRAVRLTLLAAFLAILTSSIFYNAFFEDPTTWILMALLVLTATSLDTAASPEQRA
jgi:O-antigen ligase